MICSYTLVMTILILVQSVGGSLPGKFYNSSRNFMKDVALKWAKMTNKDWKWVKTSVCDLSPMCRQETRQMAFRTRDEWIFMKRASVPLIAVPGGLCPMSWSDAYWKVKFAKQTDLKLNYWWKWPNSMVNIQFETDYKYTTDSHYLKRIEEGIRIAVAKILEEFVVPGCVIEPIKKNFMQKLKFKKSR